MLRWPRMEPPNLDAQNAVMRSSDVFGAGSRVSTITVQNVVLEAHKWEAWH